MKVDFLASWERHGVSVLERVAKRDPAAFITAAVALVPITAPLPLPSPSRSKRARAPGRRPARRAAGRLSPAAPRSSFPCRPWAAALTRRGDASTWSFNVPAGNMQLWTTVGLQQPQIRARLPLQD